MSLAASISGLIGRRVQLSGSASKEEDTNLIHYAHNIIKLLTERILEEGGGLILSVGKEPLKDDSLDSPCIIFDWTVLETVAACFRQGRCGWSGTVGPPIIVITSQKHVSDIPEHRRHLWKELRESGLMNVEYIHPGARSAAMIRDRQAQLADILIILSGGTGVEHSALLFNNHKRHVIPLDLNLGASREDGTGGAYKLWQQASKDPNNFFSLQPEFSNTTGAMYSSLETREGKEDVTIVVNNAMKLLHALALPRAFYTRLLNPTVDSFSEVEDFFRKVVDPVVVDAGFCRIELGTDSTPEPFINVAIFENIHYASVAVVDLTAERPNCYMELGYAFGRGVKVIVTAKDGTELPFDPNAIPCHFWKLNEDDEERKTNLKEFWKKYIDRRPLVT